MLSERIPEELGRHYAIAFPGREPRTARNLRHSPLHGRLAAKGARFGPRFGWERPLWFAPMDESGGEVVDETLTFGRPGWFERVAAEHRAAREAVAVFDQTSFGKLLVQGPDAEAFLQRLCANDMAVRPGRAVYTAMLNRRGGFESDLTLLRLSGEAYMMVTGTSQVRRDADWLRRNMTGEERVTLSDVTSAYAVLGVMGPRARELLQCLTDADLSNQAFPYFTWREIDLGSARAMAARLSYAGELGWELYVPTECACSVYDQIMEAGAGLGVRDAGAQALTSLRIEKAYRAWGHDIGPDDTPLEAGLDFAVKLDKADNFIGREALLKQRETGVSRRLVVLTLEDPEALPIGDEPILGADEILGQVTSAAFGHSIGRAVALGYLRLPKGVKTDAFLDEGGLALDIAGKPFAASASLQPVWDTKGARIRG